MNWLKGPLIALVITATAGVASAQATPPAARQRPGAARPAADTAARVAALGSADADVAARAADALGAIREAWALDALLDALLLGLPPRVAAAALAGVAAHADARVHDVVEIYLRHRDGAVRTAAILAMGALEDARTGGHLMAALRDGHRDVRAAAMVVITARNMREAIEPMLELLKKGDEAAVPALATLANADVARGLGELIGVAPDVLVARALGQILARADFGPETARVQVVRALGKVPGSEAVTELRRYIAATPETPPRQSRREAEAFVQARSGAPGPAGGQP